jgi:hypothetical protein
MGIKRVYLDVNHNIVPKEKARWCVLHTYKDEELLKEEWIDLEAPIE